MTAEEIRRIEDLANREVLSNTAVDAFETSKDEALAAGAIAFFGDKYGDTVRVLRAGSSVELCGGTHVSATGDIGTIKIVSEGSIGSNLRRIEAVTGANTVRLMQGYDDVLARASALVGAKPEELVAGVERRIEELRAAQDEVKVLRARLAAGRAAEISARADGGVLVERIDGLSANDLRDLAVAVRQQGVGIVVLCGVTDAGGVSLVAAVNQAAGVQAGELIKDAARSVGGGGGGKGDVATAGGKNPDGIEEALRIAGEKARAASARS
ncbi:MAG: hypothetical protein EBT79_00700 [Actinobacteria bacterium]|nr:hypothetical protein [Actinomycetota bacterium]